MCVSKTPVAIMENGMAQSETCAVSWTIKQINEALHASATEGSDLICYMGKQNANIPGDLRGVTCVFAEIGDR